MAFSNVPYAQLTLTANGSAAGFVTVASTHLLRQGATVYLSATGVTTKALIIDGFNGSTEVFLRDPAISGNYARFNCSSYTTAAGAVLTQPIQGDFYVPDDGAVLGDVTATGLNVTNTPIILPPSETADLPDAATWAGSIVYDIDDDEVKFSDGSTWAAMGGGGGGTVAGVTGTAPITVDNTDPANPIVGSTAATTATAGHVTASSQSFSGTKTFLAGIAIPTGQNATLAGTAAIANSNDTLSLSGNDADGASAIGVIINNATTFTDTAARVLSIQNNGTEKAWFDKDGKLIITGATSQAIAIPVNKGIQWTGGTNMYSDGSQVNFSGGVSSTYYQCWGPFAVFGGSDILMVGGGGKFRGDGVRVIIEGGEADSGTTRAVDIQTGVNLTTAGAKILSVRNQVTEKMAVDKDGGIRMDGTDASGTPGAATINKPRGKVAIDAAADSVVVTNALVTANSMVIPVLETDDATLTRILRVELGTGSFEIFGDAAATAPCTVSFLVINPL